MADFSQYVSDAFSGLTPNLYGIYNDAIGYNLNGWQTLQSSLVTASGAGAMAIPGLHLVAIAADIAFLMNRMSVCAYGIGAIVGAESGNGFILEEEDFAVILGRWCKVEGLENAALSKGAAELSVKVGGKVGGKVLSKEIAKYAVKQVGILVGKKLGGKVGAKIGAKFGAKLGAKIGAGFIPFLGPIVGGGINLYFITEISREARLWYEFKIHG